MLALTFGSRCPLLHLGHGSGVRAEQKGNTSKFPLFLSQEHLLMMILEALGFGQLRVVPASQFHDAPQHVHLSSVGLAHAGHVGRIQCLRRLIATAWCTVPVWLAELPKVCKKDHNSSKTWL